MTDARIHASSECYHTPSNKQTHIYTRTESNMKLSTYFLTSTSHTFFARNVVVVFHNKMTRTHCFLRHIFLFSALVLEIERLRVSILKDYHLHFAIETIKFHSCDGLSLPYLVNLGLLEKTRLAWIDSTSKQRLGCRNDVFSEDTWVLRSLL